MSRRPRLSDPYLLIGILATLLASLVGVPAWAATVPASPSAVTVLPGNTAVQVSWAVPASDGGAAVTGYTARAWTQSSGGRISARCSTTSARTCGITGLRNGTNYYVDVVATNSAGTSSPSTPRVRAVPVAVVPGAPGGIVVSPASGALQVGWTAPPVSGVSGYTARAWTAMTGGTSVGSCTTRGALSCSVSGLMNGSTYYVDVVARNSAGTGAASSPRVAGTPRAVPGAPTSVLATAGDARVAVSWAAPTSTGGATITEYRASAWSAASGGSVVATCVTPANSCDVTGLENGTTYYVDVVATNVAGPGAASSPRLAATPTGAPGAPSGVTVLAGGGRLDVTWVAPVTDGGAALTSYSARAWSATTGGTVVASCATTGALACPITGLPNGTTVFVDVLVTNATGGTATSSPRVAGTPRAVPAAPRGVAITPADGALSVGWAAPLDDGGSPVTGYTATAWSADADGTALASCSTSGALSCSLTDLANGAAYYVDVAADNAVGSGPASSPRVVGTPFGAPGPPASVDVAAGDGRLDVTFSPPVSDGGAPVSRYDVTAWTAASGGSSATTCTSGGELGCSLTGLTNGATYYVDVTATNVAGAGAASAPRVAGTPRATSTAPRDLALVAGDTTLTVSWAAPGSTGGDEITGYVARAWSASAGGSLLRSCTTNGALTCTLTSLVNGTTYFVDVVATTSLGNGPASARASGTPVGPPAAPGDVSVVSQDRALDVSWSAPASDGGSPVTGYAATAWNSATGGSVVASCETTELLACQLAGLSNGVPVYVSVSATTAVGTGPASARVAATPRTVPAVPGAVTVVAGDGVLAVSWAAPASDGGAPVSEYAVRAWTAATGGSPVGSCVTTTSTACTVADLVDGTAYYVDVTASNAAGAGPASAPRVAGTPRTTPGAVQSVVVAAKDGALGVTWVAPASDGGAPITGYTVRAWGAAVGGSALASCSTAALTCDLTGLANGTTYYVDVTATNAVGDGPVPPRTAGTPTNLPPLGAVPKAGDVITVGTATRLVDGVDVYRNTNMLVAYTTAGGKTVTTTNQWGIEAQVVGGYVTSVNNRQASGSTVGTPIPANGYVLSGHGTSADWMNANVRVGSLVLLPGQSPPPPAPCAAGNVRLTFDDGPSVTYTPKVLDTLKAKGVPATFFVIGANAAANPALVQREAAEGHRVANHTWSHPYLTQVTGQSVTPTNVYGAEVTVVGGTVVAVADRLTTLGPATPLPQGGYVLSGHGAARDWLLANAHVGSAVTLPSPVTAGSLVRIGTASYALAGQNISRGTDAMVVYTLITADQAVAAEFTRTSDTIQQLTGTRPTLWRPPFSDYDDAIVSVAASLGLTMMLFDVDSYDWNGLTADQVVSTVVSGVRDGSVVDLHDLGANTATALPTIIDQLRARGYCFVR